MDLWRFWSQVDDENDCVSFDLRPSDAINIAVRCKVYIFATVLISAHGFLRFWIWIIVAEAYIIIIYILLGADTGEQILGS